MSTAHADTDRPRLIADIGGTNARFALIAGDDDTPHMEHVLPCKDFSGPVAAIEQYLAHAGIARPRQAAIAVAMPVMGDQVKMTNHVWSFSIEETRRRLGLDRLLVINDFTALAMALPHLKPDGRRQIGSGEPVAETPIALIGPGTGLGVSGLIPGGDRWIPLHTEGGHVTFSPGTEREMDIVRIVWRRFEHVSPERLVSGPGLVNLYEAVAELHGVAAETLSPADITQRGQRGSCPVCVETLETFCAMLGTAAGNLVLSLGARGGVYIGGGIVPRLGDYFDSSPFRDRFERKGRFSGFMASVPSYVIQAQHPAFIGVAKAFSAFA
jgi:glucokinase